MQMINVLKKLAELDAQNPNIVKEDSTLEECGPMGMMDASQPHTPASINMTAGSGEELGDMLKTIMSLAGVHKVEPEHLGAEMPPAVVTAEPAMGVDAGHDQEGSAGDIMRSMMDKMNPDGEEETDEEYNNNTPNDPNDVPKFDSNKFAYQPNSGSTHGRAQKNNPHGNPATMEQQLMADYKKFVAESNDYSFIDKVDLDTVGWNYYEEHGERDGMARVVEKTLNLPKGVMGFDDTQLTFGDATVGHLDNTIREMIEATKQFMAKNPEHVQDTIAYVKKHHHGGGAWESMAESDYAYVKNNFQNVMVNGQIVGTTADGGKTFISSRPNEFKSGPMPQGAVVDKQIQRVNSNPMRRDMPNKQGMAESDVPTVDQGEYDQEGDMLKDNLMTIEREAKDLVDSIHDNENLPEWVEDKISQAKGMIVAVAEYMKTQHERGQDHDMADSTPTETMTSETDQYALEDIAKLAGLK